MENFLRRESRSVARFPGERRRVLWFSGRTGRRLGSTPRDRGDDAHLVLVGDRGREVVQVADVLVVHINVDEAAQLVPREDALAERRVLQPEGGEDLADGGTRGLDDVAAAGVGAERGG